MERRRRAVVMIVMALGHADAGRAGIAGQAGVLRECVDEQPRAADRRQPEHRVCLGAHGIVDLRDDVLDAERLSSQLRCERVAVVTLGQGEEPLGLLDADATEHVLICAVGTNRLTREVRFEAIERFGADVDDRDVVAGARQALRDSRPDSAATDDHRSHSVLNLHSCRSSVTWPPCHCRATGFGSATLWAGWAWMQTPARASSRSAERSRGWPKESLRARR